MNSELATRTKLDIMEELLSITNDMLSNSDSLEALTEGVENRQILMNEFDVLPDDFAQSEESKLEIKKIAKEIIKKDIIIRRSLERFQAQIKTTLSENTAQRRVLSYANNIAASGSYLDIKK